MPEIKKTAMVTVCGRPNVGYVHMAWHLLFLDIH